MIIVGVIVFLKFVYVLNLLLVRKFDFFFEGGVKNRVCVLFVRFN